MFSDEILVREDKRRRGDEGTEGAGEALSRKLLPDSKGLPRICLLVEVGVGDLDVDFQSISRPAIGVF